MSSIKREALHVLARALLVDGLTDMVDDITPPLIQCELFGQFFDMLENVVAFSGDGRQAVIEVSGVFIAFTTVSSQHVVLLLGAKFLVCHKFKAGGI